VALLLLDAVLIFALLLLFYLLTYSGSFRIDDEHILVARAQSLAFWDHIQYPQVYGNDRVRHLSTILEDVASPVVAIEPGQAFLGSLLYKFASAFDLAGVQAYFTMNLYATALTGALVYLSVHLLGYTRCTAIIAALTYGVGTMAWPYSKTAFRDPLAACAVAISMLGWVLLLRKSGRVKLTGAIIFIFGTIGGLFFKSNVLVLLPSFLFSVLVLAYHGRKGAMFDRKTITIGFLPILLLIVFSLTVSNPGPLSRFSMSYYVESLSKYLQNVNHQTLLATLGPFFSPSKSIFLFNPIFLLIPWIVVRNWRELKPIALPALLSMSFLAVFQALHLREQWAGTLVWGLRFMLPVLPLLTLLLAPWLDGLISNGFNRKRGLAWLFLFSSILIRLSGAVVAWNVPFKAWVENGLDPYAIASIWQFEYLAIPHHVRGLFQPSSWDIAWLRTLQTQGWVVILLIIALALITLVVVLFRKKSLEVQKDRIIPYLVIASVIFASCLPVFPSLWLLRMDPSSGGDSVELRHLVHWAEKEARAGDLVVVDSYGTDLWRRMMNDWDKPIPWYSLPYEIPGSGQIGTEVGGNPAQATLELFNKLGNPYSRLIYLTSQETPDFSIMREVSWLEANYQLEKEVELYGDTIFKASVYLPEQVH